MKCWWGASSYNTPMSENNPGPFSSFNRHTQRESAALRGCTKLSVTDVASDLVIKVVKLMCWEEQDSWLACIWWMVIHWSNSPESLIVHEFSSWEKVTAAVFKRPSTEEAKLHILYFFNISLLLCRSAPTKLSIKIHLLSEEHVL